MTYKPVYSGDNTNKELSGFFPCDLFGSPVCIKFIFNTLPQLSRIKQIPKIVVLSGFNQAKFLYHLPFFLTLLPTRIANITRLFYWLGERFDTALLIQSILMIIAQLGLLKICLKYSDPISPIIEGRGSSNPTLFNVEDLEPLNQSAGITSPRPLTLLSPDLTVPSIDQQSPRIISSHHPSMKSKSQSFDYYVDFFALLFAVEAALFILLQRYDWFIQTIGFVSLGLESTLPIPQLVTNFRRKSLAGLSPMVLVGWLFGDTFKSIYLVFITPDSNSIQFKICALFQLSIDLLILFQALIYRRQTKLDSIELGRSTSTSGSSQSQETITYEHLPHSQLTIDDSANDHAPSYN